MFVVGFAAEVGVDVGVVGVAAVAQGHVGRCAAGGFADDGLRGVGADALRGVHGDGIAEADMLTQVIVFEDDAGVVGEPFGGDAVGLWSMPATPPAIPCAHLLGMIPVSAGPHALGCGHRRCDG
jgi:hypothetical protein